MGANMNIHDVIHKTGSAYHIATPPKEDHRPSHGYRQHAQKCGKVWPSGFRNLRADKQTGQTENSFQ